jgi:hypothetical protein
MDGPLIEHQREATGSALFGAVVGWHSVHALST